MMEPYWGLLFVFGLILLGTVVLVVVIWQLFVGSRARAVLAREQEYRTLAEAAAEQHRETGRRLDDLADQLGEVRERMGRLERILHEVE